MASTNFVDSQTPVVAAWLNDVNDFVYAGIAPPGFSFASISVFANNSAAIAGGLTAGQVYRTSTGQLMVVY